MTTTNRITYHVHYTDDEGAIQEAENMEELDDVARCIPSPTCVLTNSFGRVLAIGSAMDVAVRWAECYAPNL